MATATHQDLAARWFIYTAIVFFLITILVGLTMAIKFIVPEFLGGLGPLSFGRIRPIHTNGVLFGWLLAADMGLCFYVVPRLCGTRLLSEKLGMATLALWVVIILSAVVFLLKVKITEKMHDGIVRQLEAQLNEG